MTKKAFTYEYARPAVTADVVLITREAQPRVLLIQRAREPFVGTWALNRHDVAMTTGALIEEKCCAVLLAAGTGSRFRAGGHKLWADLRDRPVYRWALPDDVGTGNTGVTKRILMPQPYVVRSNLR